MTNVLLPDAEKSRVELVRKINDAVIAVTRELALQCRDIFVAEVSPLTSPLATNQSQLEDIASPFDTAKHTARNMETVSTNCRAIVLLDQIHAATALASVFEHDRISAEQAIELGSRIMALDAAMFANHVDIRHFLKLLSDAVVELVDETVEPATQDIEYSRQTWFKLHAYIEGVLEPKPGPESAQNGSTETAIQPHPATDALNELKGVVYDIGTHLNAGNNPL